MSIARKITGTAKLGSSVDDGGTYTDDVFSTYLYTGTSEDIFNGIDLANEGGLVWIKNRSSSASHALFDTERGVREHLASDNNNRSTNYGPYGVLAWYDNGFRISGNDPMTNEPDKDYTSWTFRKAPEFFDVVKWSGDGVYGRKVPHNLGVTPGLAIIKASNADGPSAQWMVRHKALAVNQFMYLSQTDAAMDSNNGGPNNEVFGMDEEGLTFNTDWSPFTNDSGREYIAYLFGHDETDSGQIQCGTYTGTGGDLSIDLGWEPQLIMIKPANATGNWELFDSTRGISNISSYTLRPNSSSVEADFGGGSVTLNSNGFSVNVDFGVSGREYIYMAIRKPNKPRPFVGHYVDDVFSTYLYEGDQSSSSRAIVNGIDLDGEGGMVWIKERSQDRSHCLYDTERGAGAHLETDRDQPESAFSNGNLQSFNSDGFTLGDFFGISETGEDFTSWTFRKAPSFFDVVTYTGDGVAGREIPHNLGVEPGMVIIKVTSNAENWIVYHRGLSDPAKEYLVLNQPGALNGNTAIFNSTAPTSSVFTVGSTASVNANGDEYVAYVFAHDDHEDGYIQCGTFNNANYDVEIDFGWEPQWILFKDAQSTSDWRIIDNMRGSTDSQQTTLRANLSDAELEVATLVEFTPRGVIQKVAYSSDYIFMAMRRPNKPASEFEPEELFAISEGDGLAEPAYTSGFPVDMEFIRSPKTAGGSTEIASRLTGAELIRTNSDNAGSPEAKTTFDYMEGWRDQDNFAGNYLSWMWRRAPGFFDVVTHTCDGNQGTLYPHGLGVVPDMVWRKERNATGDWRVWVRAMPNTSDGANGGTKLNTDLPYYPSDTQWASKVPPTDTHLSNGVFRTAGREIVSYLFASVPGICDIGTYTGNGVGPWSSPGDSLKVDCGFTNGARFVLVKRTDAQANWIFFDTLRGSQSTLSFNTTGAEVLAQYGTDAPWPLYPQGFAVVDYNFDTELHNPNISGAEYIYMAIA